MTSMIVWDVYIMNPEEFKRITKIGWSNIRKRKIRMLVDTGASFPLIPMNIANELNLTFYDKIPLRGLCDREILCWRSSAVFAINVEDELRYAITFVFIPIEDLCDFFKQLREHNIDGILGLSAISSFNVAIDTKTGKPKLLPYLVV